MENLLSSVPSHATLPDRFVFPPDQRPPASTCAVSLPVIDLSRGRDEVRRAVLDAGKELGFFQASGQPRRVRGGDTGHGGGVRGVLPAPVGGEGGLLLGGHGQAQPALLQHHLRDRRREVLAGLPPPRLRLARRRLQKRLAGRAPKAPRGGGEVRGADERRGDGAAEAAVRGHGAPAGLLRGAPQRRRRDHQREPLPAVPCPGPHAGPAAALRPEPHHPAAPEHRPRPPGLLQGRLDQRRARAQRLRRQLRPPARDCDQRVSEEHRAPGDDQCGAGTDVGGDVHHAGRGQPRRPRGGARRRGQPAALPQCDFPRVHARVQDRRREEGERGEGLQALELSQLTSYLNWRSVAVLQSSKET